MTGMSKRKKEISAKVEPGKLYTFEQAVSLLKECSSLVKFPESLDVALRTGIDARKSDQNLRGAVVLPHGTGKKVRVAVFAQGDNVAVAQEAGADVVGFDDLAANIKKGEMDFDVVIATPDSMRVVGQLGQILGPKGLMPNPKVGTVTKDVATAVKNAKSGQVRYRNDKNGIIHCSLGKVSFEPSAIKENLEALMAELKKNKPASAKGTYFKKCVLSTTMGPGLAIDLSTVTY